jgi:Mrp family chromosome partitioning ATPase
MMQRDVVQRIVPAVLKALDPHVVLIDLPPILSANDAVAFLPQVESCVLVVGGGQTTPHEIEESERQLGDASHFLGVILNKAESWAEPSYPYEPLP